MTDRLYCREGDTFALFDFEERRIHIEAEDPHPGGIHPELPPFYVNVETFWAVVGRIKELDFLNEVRAEKKSWEIP
jgi:hypothetical protein